jgi:Mrp family chromosome partitioning ATPase
LDVPDGLTALAGAISSVNDHVEDRGDNRAEAAKENPSRRERFVNLYEAPQISFEQAKPAFPLLDADFDFHWKQQVRSLRTRLSQMQAELREKQQAPLNIVAVTSLAKDRPRHGLAANLAYTLATVQDNRVLLIDARLPQPGQEVRWGLGAQLSLGEVPGLCEATRLEREKLPQCFQRISGSQLYLMPAGQAEQFDFDPVDLRGLHLLLYGLRPQFDWILIDAPSYDCPADAIALNQCADGTIFVVEREQDNFADMSRALGQTQGRYLLGAVLV